MRGNSGPRVARFPVLVPEGSDVDLDAGPDGVVAAVHLVIVKKLLEGLG